MSTFRRMMMGGGRYLEVEYITGANTTYIITPQFEIDTSKDVLNLYFSCSAYPTQFPWSSPSPKCYYIAKNNNSRFECKIGSGWGKYGSLTLNTKYSLYGHSTTIDLFNKEGSSPSHFYYSISDFKTNIAIPCESILKFYKSTINDKELIPCIDSKTNQVGIYNQFTKRFETTSGTANHFVAGPLTGKTF